MQTRFKRSVLTIRLLTFCFAIILTTVCESNAACSAPCQQENSAGFEDLPPGQFEKAKTPVGIFENATGNVLIDHKHAKTGKHCLQIAGGESGSTIELRLDEKIQTNGRLSFWAERWTVRTPFKFRIEKLVGEENSDDNWIEIYSGDEKVRVGRPFLSRIEIPLNDPAIKRLRFSATSPPNTGILIDDLKIAPAKPQRIASVELVPFTLPALTGTAKPSALTKLKITTIGTLDPISLTGLKANLADDSTIKSVGSIRVFYGGNESNFRWQTDFGKAMSPMDSGDFTFEGNRQLVEGENYVWLGCDLKQTANIDQTLTSKISSVTFSNGESKIIKSDPSVQRMGVAVRSAGDDGVHTYRIPGLATTNKGTLIGVYDIRRDKGRDLPGNIDVGMSRSTDGGLTWQPMRIIMDMGDDPKFNGEGIGDPSILVDRKTGTIWVSATWSHGNRSWNGSGPGLEPEETGQWIMVKSDDDGVNWSDPINITKQVKKPEWSFLLQGPGKGITMSDGTIVFPAQYQDPPNAADKKAHRLPHSTFIYSRNHGKNWEVATGAWDDTTESQIVELDDGRLMLNCRYNPQPRRAIMTTTDMGKSWQQHSTHVNALIEPRACMASLINVGRELAWRRLATDTIADSNPNKNDFLLFSNPDSLKGRNHITIKASTDAGKTWSAKHHLLLDEQRGAGYSCMTMIDAETVGILYEGSQAHMTFQRVKLADILNPPKNQKTKNADLAIMRRPQRNLEKLTLARPFQDHMVLQAEQPIRVWGIAPPGEQVSVAFSGLSQTSTAIAGEEGNWTAVLPAQPVNKQPQTLNVSTRSHRLLVSNILIGEVWLCAGQSNMEWELGKSENGRDAIRDANDSLLRLLNCPGRARGGSGIYSKKELERLWPESFSSGDWRVDNPVSAAKFSAVGYFFAKRIRAELDVPVGIINVSVGGTPIESWVSPSKLKSHSELSKMFAANWLNNPILDQWCKERAKQNLQRALNGEFEPPSDDNGPHHSFKPGFMFKAGIAPIAPMSIRGVLWYQGESNADNLQRIKIYDSCFPLLVDDLRDHFQNPNMPLAFVQLPAMSRPNWPIFRDYQRRSLDHLSNVGMAITVDTGHPTNVHPAAKKIVGERLAQWALVETYQRNGVAMGPLLKGQSKLEGKIAVEFTHCGNGLKTSDGKPPQHFEIAAANKVFVSASAKIVGKNRVVLSSDQIVKPEFVRYAWRPFPEPKVNLINSENLPASPFTTEPMEK